MQYLNITDFDSLYSLDLREWNNMLKGAMLRDIKAYEDMAVQAIFTARAANEKRVDVKKLFNADKAKRQILKQEEPVKDFSRFDKAQEAMKGFTLQVS